VTIIVDANIVFSAILNTKGQFGDLLINSGSQFRFLAPDFLRQEIRKHHRRLASLSGMTLAQVQEAEFNVCHDISFISEEQIRLSAWRSALRLVSDVDPSDAVYIAMSRHFRCRLWSGDKQLIRGLTKKGFDAFISTKELLELRARRSS